MRDRKIEGQRSGKVNVLLALVSALISLLMLEVGLRILAPIPVPSASTVAPKAELYGWAMEPNSVSTFYNPDTGQAVRFRTNSQGWKDVEHRFEKPEGVVRILFLGDSVTFGIVALEDTYHRQVERLLHERGYTQVEVIAIGMSGWGTDQALEALLNEGLAYDPDVVIYQFTDNDVLGNVLPFEDTPPQAIAAAKPFRYVVEPDADGALYIDRVALVPYYDSGRVEPVGWRRVLSRSASYYQAQQAVNLMVERFREDEWAPSLADYFGKPDPTNPLFVYGAGEPAPELEAAWQLTEALILLMKFRVLEQGAGFAVFSQDGEPGSRDWLLDWGFIEADDDADYIEWDGTRYEVDYGRTNEVLADFAARYRIPLILPTRTYERYGYDPHPNAAGNLSMAEDVVDFLVEWEWFQAAVGE